MVRFILKILLFITLVLSIILTVTRVKSLKNEHKSFANYDTDENLYSIKKNEHYDFLLMGI
jgi:thioredoxin-related protein